MENKKEIIVDENDNVIGYKEREKIKQEDIYRVSALWINNSKGEFLLAKRAFIKNNDPGKWGPAVAGTVEDGENYKENIIKEAEEELGLKNIKFEKSSKLRVTGKHNYFTQWYILTIDKPVEEFDIQADEVAEIKWFSKEEFDKFIKEDSTAFLEKMKEYVRKFVK